MRMLFYNHACRCLTRVFFVEELSCGGAIVGCAPCDTLPAVNLNIDGTKSDQNVRGQVNPLHDSPSALRDCFAAHETGLHHVACFVPDLAAAVAGFASRGVSAALEARTTTGVSFAMLDTRRSLGHMLELYEPGEALTRFYAFIRRKAVDWDGSEPLRRLT